MNLCVAPFDGSPADWDSFIERFNGWTHFHKFGWKRVIEREFGHACHYLGARDSAGRLVGVLPLVRVKSHLFGDYLLSMPFLNYGGPLGSPEAVRSLVETATDLARSGGADLLEMRSADALDVDLPVSHRKVTVLLDLPSDDPDRLWSGLRSKLRSQIRRPTKEGVIVRIGADLVEPFYRVFSRHMRDLGTPVLPKTFFQEIVAHFGDDVRIACAFLDHQPVAAGFGFRWGEEFEITWASCLKTHNRIAPNMLVYWSLMKQCVEEGARRFNFGRCSPGSGTHRFKLQWGGREVPLWWYQWSHDPEAHTPSPDEGAYSWGPRIWKRLPVGLATALGPRIVKYLP